MTDSTHPRAASRYLWLKALWRSWQLMDDRNLGLIAAGVGFYALLSVFPALAAGIAIWGYWADPALIADQLALLEGLVPESAFRLVETQMTALVAANRSTLQWTTVVSILLAFWSSRAATAALIRGLNAVFEAPHRKNVIVRTLVAVFLTGVIIAVALLAIAAVVLAPAVMAFVPLSFGVELAVTFVKWLILIAVVAFAIALTYRYGPNRKRFSKTWLTPGVWGAVLFWTLGSAALSFYVSNFGNFNEVYGSLGAVVALLFWFYLSALITLLGAQFDAQVDRLKNLAADPPSNGRPAAASARDPLLAEETGPDAGHGLP